MSEQAQDETPKTDNGETAALAERKDRERQRTIERSKEFATDDIGVFRPRNLDQATQLANILSNSQFVPQTYQGRPGDCMAAILLGAEVGLGPMQALRSIAVINGMPSIWGDGFLGLIKAAPGFDGVEEMSSEEINKAGKAVCTMHRAGHAPVTRTFSLEDAKKAGLTNKKGPWQDYRPRMLQMRARSWAGRDQWADVLGGLAVREEAVDAIDTVGEPSKPKALAERLQERAAETRPEATKLDELLEQIRNAKSRSELMKIGLSVNTSKGDLSEDDVAKAQVLWKEHYDAAPDAPKDYDPSTGEMSPEDEARIAEEEERNG